MSLLEEISPPHWLPHHFRQNERLLNMTNMALYKLATFTRRALSRSLNLFFQAWQALIQMPKILELVNLIL